MTQLQLSYLKGAETALLAKMLTFLSQLCKIGNADFNVQLQKVPANVTNVFLDSRTTTGRTRSIVTFTNVRKIKTIAVFVLLLNGR